MINLPSEYLKNMKELLQDDFDAYLESFNNPIYTGIRINTNKISVDDFLKLTKFDIEKIEWTKNGFYVKESDLVSKHPYYSCGLYYIQEASAMLPGQIMDLKEDDIVLDGCASPGGKTTQLGLNIRNGLLVSNDLSSSRQIGTVKNVELFGFDNCLVMANDIIDLAKKYPQHFDAVLIDAPCSGEGMFHKDNSLIKEWYVGINQHYSAIQKEIIEAAYKLLKKGGQLVYSTCTFSKLENEDVVSYLLENHSDMHLLPIFNCPSFTDGVGLKETKRLYPFKCKGEGHFVAYLKKDGTIEAKTLTKQTVKLNEHVLKEFNGYVKTINDNCYIVNKNMEPFFSERILRSGLLVGKIDHDKLKYSTALALSLKEKEFDLTINYSCDDINLIKYLKGETIKCDLDGKGYILICVDHYPCGFGYLENGFIKNKLEKGFIVK